MEQGYIDDEADQAARADPVGRLFYSAVRNGSPDLYVELRMPYPRCMRGSWPRGATTGEGECPPPGILGSYKELAAQRPTPKLTPPPPARPPAPSCGMQASIEGMAKKYRVHVFVLTVAVTMFKNLEAPSVEAHGAPTLLVSLLCLIVAAIVMRALKSLAKIQLYCNLTLQESLSIAWEVSTRSLGIGRSLGFSR